nr:MAG TPA: hypothetical protein [Caudoviricetes sp.]
MSITIKIYCQMSNLSSFFSSFVNFFYDFKIEVCIWIL